LATNELRRCEETLPSGLEASPNRPVAQRLLRWLGRAAISAAVLAWLLWQIEWSPLVEVVSQVELGWCGVALGVLFSAQVLSSYRWQILARALGFEDRLRTFLRLYLVGMFFNLFLPTSVGGDVVKAWLLAGGKGRRWRAMVTVLSERFSGLLALLLIAALATLPSFTLLPPWMILLAWGALGGAAGGMVALPLLAGRSERLRLVAEGVGVYRGHLKRWLIAFGLSLLVQALSIAQVALLGVALGLDLPLQAYAVVVPMVSLLTMLPVSVNGVGVREGSMVLMLGVWGLAPEGAVALGLLWFAVQATVGFLGGAVYTLGRMRWSSRLDRNSSFVQGKYDASVRGDSNQGRARKPAAAA
jgi:hypothetical protein